MNARLTPAPISLDTAETRRAYLDATEEETVSDLYAAHLIGNVAIKSAYLSFSGDLRFLTVKTGRGVEIYLLIGDDVERISEPCELCDESGRVEQFHGPASRWAPCSCSAGHGPVGRWV
jgi:hypothetical protein